MRCGGLWIVLTLAVALVVCSKTAAITIDIDYTYDLPANGGSNFFGGGNPQGPTGGAQARAAMEAATGYFSTILNDTFDAISVPPPYRSTFPGSTGLVTWFFEQRFQHPSGTTEIVVPNPVIPDASVPSNTYIIYAGARNLGPSVAGNGAVGGQFRGNVVSGTNQFTDSDISYIQQTSTNFFDAVDTRGEPDGFARWGGSITFDTAVSPPWHFNHTISPSGNVRDFYSVAVHELAHALGFGSQSSNSATPWEELVSNFSFTGDSAMSVNNNQPVPLSGDRAHWQNGKMSTVYGGLAAQEAAMDPDLLNGTRKHFAILDAYAMRDIGWEVVAPPVPVLYGDYNNNGRVDAADYVLWRENLNKNVVLPNDQSAGSVNLGDYTVWRNNFGRALGLGSGSLFATVPEPSALTVALCGLGLLVSPRRKQRR